MTGRLDTPPAREEPDGAGSAGPDMLAAAQVLAEASDVTLFAHVNPDADALGSALALGTALRRRGATVRVAFGEPERTPVSLRALDDQGLLVPVEAIPTAPPTLVVLDTGSSQRLGKLADRVEASIAGGGEVIVVDHHVSNTRFGTKHVIDERAEATALIVLRLLDVLEETIDVSIARCLYAGLVTDTRSFRNASVAAHLAAARLVDTGIEPATMARSLMDTHPFSWLEMLSGVLGAACLEPSAAQGLGFVHAIVHQSQTRGLGSEETNSIIDIVRTTSEAEVTAVLKETGPERWSVSLRANRALDVGQAAAVCGGGGHRLAAGFVAEGSPERVLDMLRQALDTAPLLD